MRNKISKIIIAGLFIVFIIGGMYCLIKLFSSSDDYIPEKRELSYSELLQVINNKEAKIYYRESDVLYMDIDEKLSEGYEDIYIFNYYDFILDNYEDWLDSKEGQKIYNEYLDYDKCSEYSFYDYYLNKYYQIELSENNKISSKCDYSGSIIRPTIEEAEFRQIDGLRLFLYIHLEKIGLTKTRQVYTFKKGQVVNIEDPYIATGHDSNPYANGLCYGPDDLFC